MTLTPCPVPGSVGIDNPLGIGDTAPVGAVAQLGERVVRNDEVRGSIPLGSTTPTFGSAGPRILPRPRIGRASIPRRAAQPDDPWGRHPHAAGALPIG